VNFWEWLEIRLFIIFITFYTISYAYWHILKRLRPAHLLLLSFCFVNRYVLIEINKWWWWWWWWWRWCWWWWYWCNDTDVCDTVRVDLTKRDECGRMSEDELHHVWVVAICICFIRFVVKVSRFTSSIHRSTSFLPSIIRDALTVILRPTTTSFMSSQVKSSRL